MKLRFCAAITIGVIAAVVTTVLLCKQTRLNDVDIIALSIVVYAAGTIGTMEITEPKKQGKKLDLEARKGEKAA